MKTPVSRGTAHEGDHAGTGENAHSAHDHETPLTETLDKTPPHGMKGALPSPGFLSPRTLLLGASVILMLAILVTAVLLVMEWRRRKASRMMPQLTADPTAWARLREEISRIVVPSESVTVSTEGSGSSSVNISVDKAWSHFSSEVSLCLRRALELRTNSPLAESTTEEILHLLANDRIRLVAITDQELRETLTRLDAIRFGGQRVSHSEGQVLLEALKRWSHSLEHDGENPAAEPLPRDEQGGLRVFDS